MPPSISGFPLLQISGLTLGFGPADTVNPVVNELDLDLREGEIVGLVGASGSGKSMTAAAILQLFPSRAELRQSGRITWTERDGSHTQLPSLSSREWTDYRGREIAMIYQEPMTALNPVLRCGTQLRECFRNRSPATVNREMREALQRVGITDTERILRAYPHLLSGGQQQRVQIAMALALHPRLLIADEPTTALDRDVQLEIIELLRRLRTELGLTILFITHDWSLVEALADRVLVMQKGEIVERGALSDITAQPRHPYTRALLAARPTGRLTPVQDRRDTPPLLCAEGLSQRYVTQRNWLGRPQQTLTVFESVSISIYPGEIVGLMGASGSGKSTLGRCVLGLTVPDAGTVTLNGQPLPHVGTPGFRAARRAVQLVFQDPYSSLTPRRTVRQLVAEPLEVHQMVRADRVEARVRELLTQVGLAPQEVMDRYVTQLSGGERQRVSIARVLSLEPRLIVCDECLSALDTQTQAEVLQLLLTLRAERDLAYLFISHDETVVRAVADRIYHLDKGRLTEE